MEKKRFLVGAAALIFGLGSAFAFKAGPVLQDPAYINANNECERVPVDECEGGNINCVREVPGVGSEVIYNFESTQSCAILKMRN